MTSLYGLILCGGQSSRMGEDKSLLNYHGKQQRYHLADMLQPFCEKVFISCSKHQAESGSPRYNEIVDAEKYSGIGPMAGLLSAFEKFPDNAFLVVGCDYPFLEKKHFQYLVNERTGMDDAVCFGHRETMMNEPLITIYEPIAYRKMVKQCNEFNHSLCLFLNDSNTCMIFPDNFDFLKSVNDIQTYHKAKELLTSKLN